VSEPADEDDYIEKAKFENIHDHDKPTRERLCLAGKQAASAARRERMDSRLGPWIAERRETERLPGWYARGSGWTGLSGTTMAPKWST